MTRNGPSGTQAAELRWPADGFRLLLVEDDRELVELLAAALRVERGATDLLPPPVPARKP